MRRAVAWLTILVVALAGLGFYFGMPVKNGDKTQPRIMNHLKLGLDLKGGVYQVLEGVESDLGPVTPEAIQQAKAVIENRINKLGVSEPVVQIDGKNRIVVQLADVKDTEQAKAIIGKTAALSFVGPDGKIVLDGKDIEKAGVGQQGNQFVVTLKLKGEGPKKFEEATTKFVQQRITIKLDEDIISAPVVNQPIVGDSAIIEGNFDAKGAQNLADLINGGALPIKLEVKESRVVSATLGSDSLARSAIAGLIGMAFVLVFMVVLYRLPGLMADLALVIYAVLTIAFLIAINSVMTLPGLAGLLLSIGMAVDGNVLINERIKEELKAGKGLRSSIDAGFHRAVWTVVDSQVTTLIAGVILWYFGTGPVKGFALTLSVGTILSMFTSITVTRWLINLLADTGRFGKSLFGVKEVSKA
ncbi:MAG TPA: protein translocase subunit SecD [Symbiobacteriaceae bacterium]|nr:protein translocase subunit SecD [Symbiobacteriaceae bacterium]